MQCPNCGDATTELALISHTGQPVPIDLCTACQAIWFDDRESLSLSPASTLRLFREIGDATPSERRPVKADARCPRCGLALARVQDMQRTTRFQYRRCPKRHGRLITFFDFLREKNFVRPMPPDQIAELRRHVAAVNCSNCGAAIDLAHGSTCAHCQSPLSILDATQAEKLIAELRNADKSDKPVDPDLPLRLARARRDVAASFEAFERQSGRQIDAAPGDLVVAGIRAFSKWLG